MITTTERRERRGVAIVTMRSNIKWRYESAGIPNGIYSVQDGNTWPDHRPPLVLDTIGMPLSILVALLADPPRMKQAQPDVTTRSSADAPMSKLQDKPLCLPFIAFADPHDWRTLRLLKLCPTVQLVCADDPETFRRWLPHLAGMLLTRSGNPSDGWLVDPAPELNLDPLLLAALAVLPSSPSLRVAAERCGVSESTMARMLRATKATLGLPRGDVSRFRPDELAAIILDRLGADAPMNERHV